MFVREDFCDFAKEFENLISLGKFKEIEESKEEICINKDVLSRLSSVFYKENTDFYKKRK